MVEGLVKLWDRGAPNILPVHSAPLQRLIGRAHLQKLKTLVGLRKDLTYIHNRDEDSCSSPWAFQEMIGERLTLMSGNFCSVVYR